MKKNTNPTNRVDAPVYTQEASTLLDRKKILTRLRIEATTTLTFREELDLISPAPRIRELRQLGYVIRTTPIKAQSINGRWHNNIALYTLISEPTVNNSEVAA